MRKSYEKILKDKMYDLNNEEKKEIKTLIEKITQTVFKQQQALYKNGKTLKQYLSEEKKPMKIWEDEKKKKNYFQLMNAKENENFFVLHYEEKGDIGEVYMEYPGDYTRYSLDFLTIEKIANAKIHKDIENGKYEKRKVLEALLEEIEWIIDESQKNFLTKASIDAKKEYEKIQKKQDEEKTGVSWIDQLVVDLEDNIFSDIKIEEKEIEPEKKELFEKISLEGVEIIERMSPNELKELTKTIVFQIEEFKLMEKEKNQ